MEFRISDERRSGHTSENAGAAIFLYFFHSSPSEATMFAPKIATALYRRCMGLGNLARLVVISYELRSKAFNQIDMEWTYFDSGGVCNIYYGPWHRKC